MPKGPSYKTLYNEQVRENNNLKMAITDLNEIVDEQKIGITKLNKKNDDLQEKNGKLQTQYDEEVKRKATLADVVDKTNVEELQKLKTMVVKRDIIIGYLEGKLFGKTTSEKTKEVNNGEKS